MSRYLLVSVIGLLAWSTASAQFPPQPVMANPPGYPNGAMPGPGMMNGPGAMPESPAAAAEHKKFGWLPGLRGLFSHSHKSSECGDCGNGAGGGTSHGAGHFSKSRNAAPPPAANGGTLVFPHHPFVRSPRDFFMQD